MKRKIGDLSYLAVNDGDRLPGKIPSDSLHIQYSKLADEDLLICIEYFDLLDRQRYRRMSRRWKRLLLRLSSVQHVKIPYNYSNTFLLRKLSTELKPSPTGDMINAGRPESEWKYSTSGIDTLIFHYQLDRHPDGTAVRSQMGPILTQLPFLLAARMASATSSNCSLKEIHIRGVIADTYRDLLLLLRGVHSTVSVAFTDILLAVSPRHGRWPDIIYEQDGEKFVRPRAVEDAFGPLYHLFLRIPPLTAVGSRDEQEFERSYPAYQNILDQNLLVYGLDNVEWLAKYAPCLNRFPGLLAMIHNQIFWTSEKIFCPAHDLFCEHLPLSHYQQIAIESRLHIYFCILAVNGKAGLQCPLSDFENLIPAFPLSKQHVALSVTK